MIYSSIQPVKVLPKIVTKYQEFLVFFSLILYNIFCNYWHNDWGIPLTYSYNRLWKLLIDKGITKTELKDKAGISTNIIAKMGKGEPISMESLAKVCTALKCGLDDIVEITTKRGE